MVRVALLGKQFPGQVEAGREALGDLELVWVGASVESFRREVPALAPSAVVIDIAELPELDAAGLHALLQVIRAELSLVTYGYGTRAFLRELRSDGVRVIQGPVSLETLRAHLSFLVVQDMLRARGARPHSASLPLTQGTTGDGCTCASGVEHAIAALLGVAERGRGCEARKPDDADPHQRLDVLATRARSTLEEALALKWPAPAARGPRTH